MSDDRRHGATSMERSASSDIEQPLSKPAEPAPADDAKALAISFVLMVVIGLGNKIFQKLQTIPMHNYANTLNLMTTAFYIPASFLYIVPMIRWGTLITPEQRAVPMKTFAVMGFLDSIAGIMQIFAATYLPGTLLILLSQSAIPISMGISKVLLQQKYKLPQYVGALVVAAGIIIVLGPRLDDAPSSDDADSSAAGGALGLFRAAADAGAGASPACDDDSGGESTTQVLLWSLIMIFSCVPMTLSSVYKEKAIGETDLDPVYLNGWIAVWQFLFSIPIAIPAAMVSVPAVEPSMLMTNLIDGLKCYAGHNSITSEYRAANPDFQCFESDDCEESTAFVTIYLFFNVGYNILIILILKFGSANILWLAMTVMVPLGSMAFALPFVPQHAPPKWTDVLGLLVILGGLVLYRFGQALVAKWKSVRPTPPAVRTRTQQRLRKKVGVVQGRPSSELEKGLVQGSD